MGVESNTRKLSVLFKLFIGLHLRYLYTMRRSLLRIAAATTALATGIALTACSSDDNDGASSSATASDGVFPSSVETKFGEITIDEAPQRVVALGWSDAEIALDLGVQPVGATDWLGFGNDGVSPWNDNSYEESPEILGTTEVEYEKIAALNPDLILDTRSAGEQTTYDQLSDIATTVSVPEGGDNFTTPWNTQVEMIAAALGVQDKGTELVSQVNDRINEAKAANPEWSGKTASVVAKYGEGWAAYPGGDARMDLLTALGFRQTEEITRMADGSNFFIEMSEENIDRVEADVVVGFPIGFTTEEFEGDSTWHRIGAVQDGRGIVADKDLSQAISAGTPAAMEWAVGQLEPKLAEAAEK